MQTLQFQEDVQRAVVGRYFGIKDSIIEPDEFEEELEIFKTEYSEALKTVLDKMNK